VARRIPADTPILPNKVQYQKKKHLISSDVDNSEQDPTIWHASDPDDCKESQWQLDQDTGGV
jgi:hypothetical protein